MTHEDEFYKNSSEKEMLKWMIYAISKIWTSKTALNSELKKLKVLKNHLEVKKRM